MATTAKAGPVPIKAKASAFVEPAQDKHGHSARVSFRVVPGVKREIGVMLAQGGLTLGWETESDFWRWAGRRALDELVTMTEDKKISNTHKINAIMRDILVEAQELQKFRDNFAVVEKTVRDLIQGGSEGQARTMLLRLEGQIAGLDDDSWRKMWQKEFKQKFGGMIRGAEIGKFRKAEEEGEEGA